MKSHLQYTVLIFFVFIFACVQHAEAQTSNKNNGVSCSTWECLETHKNGNAVVTGVLRKYTPEKKGKGAGHMFWDWELLLSDGNAVPVSSKNKKIRFSKFEGKEVELKGLIFYGIVIGSPDPKQQSATGYRLDPESITLKK